MKVHVEFHDDARTKARITLVPGWLGRLFGAKTRTGEAARMGYHHEWAWTSTSNNVGWRIVRELELQEVAQRPAAKVMAGGTYIGNARAGGNIIAISGHRSRCACTTPSPHPINEIAKRDPVAWWCIDCGRTIQRSTEAA